MLNQTYDDIIKYLESKNWFRENICIYQDNEKFITLNSACKNYTENIIILKCPEQKRITIPGIITSKNKKEYQFYLNINDENEIELDKDTKIRINKIKPSCEVISYFYGKYSEIKEFKFKFEFELQSEEELVIPIINCPENIPEKNIKFQIEVDYWINKEVI